MFSTVDSDQDKSISKAESDAFLTKMEEAKKSYKAPSSSWQDWQTGVHQSLFANANLTEAQSSTSVSLYA